MDSDTVRLLFSKNLKRIRLEQNMSQLALSGQAGITHNFINDIEHCKKWVSPKTLALLCAALKVEPYQFFAPLPGSGKTIDMPADPYIDKLSDSLTELAHELKQRYGSDLPKTKK